MEESVQEESEQCLGDPILFEDVGSITILNEVLEILCSLCIKKGLYGYVGILT